MLQSSLIPSLSGTSGIPAIPLNILKQQALAALESLPPFSPILDKLKASLTRQDDFALLGDLIEKDPVLAGWLLSAVNSVLYVRHGNISSVRHALSVLGTEKVRDTVVRMSTVCLVHQTRTPAGWSMERFTRHSASVAILSDLIAQRSAVEFPEGAFVAGLLHDIGRLLIAVGLPDEFESILREYQSSGQTWIECERKILGFAHPELSSAALAVWKVPEPIRRAVAEHHDPVPLQKPGGPITLGWVLNAANQYVNSIGESILPAVKPDSAGSAWIESMGLDPEVLELLLADFQAERVAIAPYFD